MRLCVPTSIFTFFFSGSDALEEERAKTNRLAELLEAAKRRLSTVEEDVAHADARYHQRSNSEEEYMQVMRHQKNIHDTANFIHLQQIHDSQ